MLETCSRQRLGPAELCQSVTRRHFKCQRPLEQSVALLPFRPPPRQIDVALLLLLLEGAARVELGARQHLHRVLHTPHHRLITQRRHLLEVDTHMVHHPRAFRAPLDHKWPLARNPEGRGGGLKVSARRRWRVESQQRKDDSWQQLHQGEGGRLKRGGARRGVVPPFDARPGWDAQEHREDVLRCQHLALRRALHRVVQLVIAVIHPGDIVLLAPR
mmetsp:Transcript_11188/g.22674  ORF Transcript_11188/g.22674 Transcript_11188/m.22674 type:complete len:216 (+) Transcript_11188:110-757(+)